ncbi:MAG: UDP binding domain-containing protein, partial [Actinomycetota bacterium]
LGVDVWEVIDAAATKPFGYMTFHPGPGVGGDRIPPDLTSLTSKARSDTGHHLRLLEQAQDVNAQMPAYVASRISEALDEAGKAIKAANVLVLGVSYKPDVGDIAESPALKTMHHLDRRGAHVTFHDPYVSEVMLNGTVLHRTELTRRAVETADCVAILTPHRVYDLEWIVEHAPAVFDARNAYRDWRNPKVQRL